MADGLQAGVPATSAIFTVPEVVENILTSLGLLDIIRAERVNRQWKDIILSSTALRTTRWIEPVDTDPPQCVGFKFVAASREFEPELSPPEAAGSVPIVDLHPALTLVPCTFAPRIECEVDIASGLRLWDSTRLRETFVTQPPCTHLTVSVHGYCGKRQVYKAMNVSDRAGVRMGRLALAVLRCEDRTRFPLDDGACAEIRIDGVVARSDWHFAKAMAKGADADWHGLLEGMARLSLL